MAELLSPLPTTTTTMITFNTQPTEYGDEWYPFFIGSFRDKIREYNQKEFHNINMLKLGYINYNPWSALFRTGVFDVEAVTALRQSSAYECPLTYKGYFALLPLCIFSEDLDKYFPQEQKPWYYEMAVDKSWNCQDDNSHLFPDQFDLETALYHCILGPGYTSSTMPNDGSPGVELVVLDLSNGDKMVAAARSWYNK